MKKVIYIAPFVKERFKGGIMRIAEYLNDDESKLIFQKYNIKLEIFNSNIIIQDKHTEGKLTLKNFRQAILFLFNLIKRVRNKDFDAIHMNSSFGIPLLKDQIIIFIATLFSNKKIYFQIHFSGIKETFIKNSYIKRIQYLLLGKNNYAILLSNDFKNQLLSVAELRSKIVVLHNFHAVKNPKYNLDCNNNRQLELVFIGSINQRKGILDLLEVLTGINIDYVLNVLGDFSSKNFEIFCKNRIDENNLNINFLGYLNDIQKERYLIDADILILPSYSEGFPMVIPEAMAYGCAIISTSIAGIPEIVEDGYNGFLFKPGHIEQLKEKIQFLNTNRNILHQFKKNSFELSSKFSLENYIEKLSSIYNL